MKRAYVLVEGASDVALLRRILPEKALEDVELVNAGGSSEIPSLARTLLVRRRRPVAVVMDSDSVEPDLIDERKQSTEGLIRLADSSVPVKVISAVPQIEAWLLEAPEIIERIVGGKVSGERLELAKMNPRRTLTSLAEKNQRRWDANQAIEALDDEDIQRIRSIPEVEELSAFLEEMHDARANGR